MYINTNISALNTLNKLTQNSVGSSKTMESLSSGKRINRASDDAAGVAVVARMNTQVRGLNQAVRNANDGVAMLQTFEGTLGSMTDVMQRMRELAIQSANGTYSDNDRANLDGEFQQLWNEINRISTSTRFNGNDYLSATFAGSRAVTLQLSDVANDVLTVNFAQTDTSTLFAAVQKISTAADAQTAIGAIDTAIGTVSQNRADMGGFMNRLEYTVENLGNSSVNLSSAKSRIEDQDMASAMSDLSKYEVLTQSSMAMLGKANQSPQSILKLLQ